jgi:hypothetical protein
VFCQLCMIAAKRRMDRWAGRAGAGWAAGNALGPN